MTRTVLMMTMAGLAALLASLTVQGAPYNSENWNSAVAQENYWCYWDETYDPFPPPQEYNYHNRPMKWSAAGGVGGSGYVWTPLSGLWSELDQRAYWPAYLVDQVTQHYGIPDRDIDLTIDDAHIQLAAKDRGLSVSVNLHGAKVYFFVGQWWTNDPTDPNDDQWAFFYNANGDFEFNATTWTKSVVPVGLGTTDWGIIAMSGLGNNSLPPPVSEARELFVSPQQWGMVIFDPNATLLPAPSGELGFDNWAIVPEPCTLGLLMLAGLAIKRRRPA
jgi:hypothetical protein